MAGWRRLSPTTTNARVGAGTVGGVERTDDGGYRFRGELWLHEGDAAWHFVTVPGDVSDDIEARTSGQPRGFGSVRVRVVVGTTTWSTSVFPDAKKGAYVLPVKQEVRRLEELAAGDEIDVVLRLADV